MDIIQIENLVKKYNGYANVINNISLNIPKGTICGVLGPSGAGKTTLVKLIIGQIKPTSGTVYVNNESCDKYTEKTFSSFGMVLDQDGLYERLSCYDNLDIFARIHNVKNKKNAINSVLKKVELYDDRKKCVSAISKGMRQRLVFARAMLHEPSILFLDEPTSGLDPATIKSIHEIILELKRKGVTILLTTHNMTEAYNMCDFIVLLHNGSIIEEGTPKEICLKHSKEKNIEIEISLSNSTTIIINEEELSDFLKEIQSKHLNIESIHSKELNLEDVFIKLTGRGLI